MGDDRGRKAGPREKDLASARRTWASKQLDSGCMLCESTERASAGGLAKFTPVLKICLFLQPSQKTFAIKQKLAKKQKQNRPIPQWIRFRTGNKIRYWAQPAISCALWYFKLSFLLFQSRTYASDS